MSKDLNPTKALIFRIVHRENMSGILDAGCHCKSTNNVGSYTQIGNAELIEKRVARPVECAPGGTLSDYVPFYFTPYTPMLYNIKTGYNGVVKRPMEDILILVSSCRVKSTVRLFRPSRVSQDCTILEQFGRP